MYYPGGGLLDRAEFVRRIYELIQDDSFINTNKNIEYCNMPAGFDIETSSFYDGPRKPENKRAIMYIWQFGIYNLVTTGRTWEEFTMLINVLKKVLGLCDNRRLVVYVHNLPYEFQFIRKRFEWEEVFLLDDRKPVYANAHGVEFRCSLKLAGGKSLANVGKDLQKYKVDKLVGDLDYDIVRTPLTPMTEKELGYCENDIRVILHYIQEKIEQDGDITKIPLTNTGYVRNYCRKQCFKRWGKYHDLMSELTVDPDEYSQLKRAFQGGFTHANAHYVNQILKNVGSYDFISSYPAVMMLEKFPISKSVVIGDFASKEEIEKLLLTKCCMFELELFDVLPKLNQDHPISRSKCYVAENCVVDNGRIVAAERLKMTVTEQDYFIYMEFYEWRHANISNFRYYDKQYLPKEFAMAILGLYEKKTILKDVPNEELNYMISKNMMNAGFGMIVTDPVRDEIKYSDDDFKKIKANVAEAIEKYNSNIRRFLYYPWGIWVTAYSRANLFSGIIEIGDDYIYSDTDSVKVLNVEKHTGYFNMYNQQTLEKVNMSASYYNIDPSRYSPVNRNGESKTIGIWEYEGIYERFKTLGAKRYLTEKNGKISVTLAGSNKVKTASYLVGTGQPFENFKDNLTIPAESSGRLILTYIDNETEGDVIDYLGTKYHYHELSSIHSEATEYNLSQSEEFRKYLEGIVDFGE